MTDGYDTHTNAEQQRGPSSSSDGASGPFAGFGGAEQAERARRVYVTWNRRVAAVRNQPSWLQKFVGYLILAGLAGLVVVLGILALVVGVILTIPILLLVLISRIVLAIKGGAPGRGAQPRDSGRANVRVISRR
jgi:hypothetical protein